MTKHIIASRTICLLFFTYVSAAYSAPPVVVPPQLDPGAIETQKQQVEKYNTEQLRIERNDKPVISAPERKETELNGSKSNPHFLLKKVTFSPSVFLKKAELDAIVQPFIEHNIGFNDIISIIGEVNKLYKSKGIVTGLAVLPPQKIISGEVHIHLIEGKLGKADVTSKYTNKAWLLSHLTLKKGEIVNIPKVERDLIWFNRTHDIQMNAVIKPGNEPGLTDFEIHSTEPKRLVMRVFADNQSAPSLGRNEVGVDARLNGLLGRDDFLNMIVTTSKGATNGYGEFGIPFDASGGQVTASYSKNNIAIVNGPYAAIDITGVSHRAAVSISQPFYVDRTWLLSSALTYAKSNSTNYVSGVMLSEFNINTYGARLLINKQGAGYQWTTQFMLENGKSIDQFNNDNNYLAYSGTFNGILSLSHSYYGVIRAGAQYATANNLPPSALFQIGGPASVRGYDVGIAAGNSGFYANVELHRNITQALNAFVFVDQGEVLSPNTSNINITGTGFGLSWVMDKLTAKLVYGQALNVIRPGQSNQQIYVQAEMTF
ncbi:MAG: BamA/TamA family outer membrane protein [Spirochaetales bacterium]|jgi:hemolysin activation/secretion protein|nr:BamA/TamA family outer membrane protein [Spirochaetales bacterium]